MSHLIDLSEEEKFKLSLNPDQIRVINLLFQFALENQKIGANAIAQSMGSVGLEQIDMKDTFKQLITEIAGKNFGITDAVFSRLQKRVN